MNVESLQNFLLPGALSSDRSLILRADSEFNLTLKLGQVLKGKVLRHYEGGRYAISFGGQEKIVDSAVPLRVGESIQGRVVGIDDKVHLQRIVDGLRNKSANDNGLARPDQRDALSALFTRYQIALTPAQHATLMKLSNGYGSSSLLGPSALVIRKLGLPLDPLLINAVHHTLQQAQQSSGGLNTDTGPKIDGHFASGAIDPAVVQGLAPIINRMVERMSSHSKQNKNWEVHDTRDYSKDSANTHQESSGEDQGGKASLLALGSWILNIQNQGSLAHRHLQFPVWLNNRLIEVQMVLFSQNGNEEEEELKPGSLRHRRVVFSLATEQLGKIEIEAIMADKHLRLALNTDREKAAELLGEHLTMLTSALVQNGWLVDEIVYRSKDSLHGVMQSIIEHQVTPNSLSRLM